MKHIDWSFLRHPKKCADKNHCARPGWEHPEDARRKDVEYAE